MSWYGQNAACEVLLLAAVLLIRLIVLRDRKKGHSQKAEKANNYYGSGNGKDHHGKSDERKKIHV